MCVELMTTTLIDPGLLRRKVIRQPTAVAKRQIVLGHTLKANTTYLCLFVRMYSSNI